jgi:hypothetical protein
MKIDQNKNHPKASAVPSVFADLWSAGRERQGKAFQEVIAITSNPVDWTEVPQEVCSSLAR